MEDLFDNLRTRRLGLVVRERAFIREPGLAFLGTAAPPPVETRPADAKISTGLSHVANLGRVLQHLLFPSNLLRYLGHIRLLVERWCVRRGLECLQVNPLANCYCILRVIHVV
jgi:hypothetical protein